MFWTHSWDITLMDAPMDMPLAAVQVEVEKQTEAHLIQEKFLLPAVSLHSAIY